MDIKVSPLSGVQQSVLTAPEEVPGSEEFKFTLQRIGEDGLTERLTGLIDEITVAGKKLTDHMYLKDLKEYKSLVSSFLNEVVSNSHEFSRENFLDRRGRHRVYGIVKLVNENLDELAQEVLKKEKDRIKILDRVDEIRGLLLDIIV